MENRETVCPRHATLAEMTPEGDLIRGVHCAWQGCDDHLRDMLSCMDTSWPVGHRPDNSEEMLQGWFDYYCVVV